MPATPKNAPWDPWGQPGAGVRPVNVQCSSNAGAALDLGGKEKSVVGTPQSLPTQHLEKSLMSSFPNNRQGIMNSPEAAGNALLAKAGTLMLTVDMEARMKQEKKAEHQRLIAEQIAQRTAEKKRQQDEEKAAEAALEARIVRDNERLMKRHLEELAAKNLPKVMKKMTVVAEPVEHDPNLFKNKITVRTEPVESIVKMLDPQSVSN